MILYYNTYIITVYAYVLQELENDITGVQQNDAVDWSFALREHEHNMAELITYDDLESVTKQLEEEREKNMEVIGLRLKQICDRVCENRSYLHKLHFIISIPFSVWVIQYLSFIEFLRKFVYMIKDNVLC